MLAALPAFDDGMVTPPDTKWPHLRCFFFFKGNSTKSDHVQVLGWSVPCLRVLHYNLDKEYSRRISRLAIPQLLDEINVLREPQQAVERFRSLVMGLGAGDEEEPFEYLE